MKDNNKTKYLLGLLLALVWGLVGFRLYTKYLKGSPNINIKTNYIVEESPTIVLDTFTLIKNYSDPFQYADVQEIGTEKATNFFNTPNYPRYPTISVEPPKQEIKIMAPVIINFPNIQYKGFIKSKQGRVVALINVEGNVSNLAINENLKGVKLTNIYEDSIQVEFKNQFKTILKVQ